MADSSTDVIVIGGGPAGAAAARLLALWGRDVVLLTTELPASAPSLAESLPPSCRKLFSALDVLNDVQSAGFVESRGNASAWGRAPLRTERFASDTGWQVVRADFDRLLLRSARAAGARVYTAARVTRVELPAATASDLGTVHWQDADGAKSLRARWVLDCSGRAGVMARAYRERDATPPTIALVAVWHAPAGWSHEDATHTLSESYADGWAWSVPVAAETRYVAAMVDPQRTALDRVGGIARLYRAEIEKTRHMRALLGPAQQRRNAWACSAVTYHAKQYAGPGWLLVGDAGSFLDPLSSAGVKKALASAYLAAVAVHTCLDTASMTQPALQLFERRERTAHAHHSALAARYYAEAAQYHTKPFWSTRAAATATMTTEDPAEVDVERDPRVRLAFELLRSDESVRLRPSARCTRVRQPTVAGRAVVLEEHLVSASAPLGVRLFRGVELPTLFDVAADHDRVPDLFDAYTRVRAPVQLPDFVGAVSALVAFGMLERTGADSSGRAASARPRSGAESQMRRTGAGSSERKAEPSNLELR